MARPKDPYQEHTNLVGSEVRPWWGSTWAGGVSGALLMIAYDDITRPAIALEGFELPWPSLGEFIGTVLVTSFYGVLGCGIGLAIFGLPISRLLRRYYRAPWLSVVALLCGGGIGGFVFAKIAGNWDAFKPGAVFGGSTGLWYWFLYRRVLIRREVAVVGAAPET